MLSGARNMCLLDAYMRCGRHDHQAWLFDMTQMQWISLHDALQSEIQPELDADKTFLQGCDKLGRPLSICVINKHSKSKRNLEQTKRYIAYSLDNSIHAVDLKTNPTGKTCAIFDLRGTHNVLPADPPQYRHFNSASASELHLPVNAGLTFDAMDRPILEVVFDLLQNHYPERYKLHHVAPSSY